MVIQDVIKFSGRLSALGGLLRWVQEELKPSWIG
jgi:hypothetical protein